MNWIALIIAGCFEIAGVYTMQRYQEQSNIKNLFAIILAFGLSFSLLSFAMKSIPMSTAYAIWTGIGASGGALISMLWFGEKKNAMRIFAIALILICAVGLKLVD